MMHENSKDLRARCHADIVAELDRLTLLDRPALETYEILHKGAQSGEWKLVNGQIMKGAIPVNDPGSLAFLVKCWAIVPALLRIVYHLETIIINLIAQRISARAEMDRAREALDTHRTEIARGQTTCPDHEFAILVGCAKLGVFRDEHLADLFRRWSAGHSIEHEVLPEYSAALEREREMLKKLDGAPDQIKNYFRVYCRNGASK
jgi:hypothetical protein